MKKLIYAWIEQIIDFDSEIEFKQYLEKLDAGKDKGRYQILSKEALLKNGVRVHIRKSYNKNAFPEF